MQNRAQLVDGIQKLAQEELPELLDEDCANLIRNAIYGYECNFVQISDRRGIIPWNLIKLLLTHPEKQTHIHPSGIRISNAHITPTYIYENEELVAIYDFFLCESTVPLLFTNCLFDGQLRFDFSKLTSLGFVESTIHSIHLRGAEVEGAITFEDSVFNRVGELSIKAHEIKIRGTLCLRKCVAVGGVRLLGATIGGDLDGEYAIWRVPLEATQDDRSRIC